jgi:hypothetical protein
MAIDEADGQPWTRKHDNPSTPVVPSAPRILYPQSLEDLIQICSTRDPSTRIHAAGSHWALSEAAISDSVFVETHDPNNVHQAMGKTLYEVVPGCLNDVFVNFLAAEMIPPFDKDNVNPNLGRYPVHIETGKRVYQLYAELDSGDTDPRSLATLLATDHNNTTYQGPWAFPTLGGAGGQTVFGALTTGTHGGDFDVPPIADGVLAIHLVADGGKHYWIEPGPILRGVLTNPFLTDDAKLKALYGDLRFGGPQNFEIVRDPDLFDAVLISAGRFGIVYSIVFSAVRQYSLHLERKLTTWLAVRDLIKDPGSALFKQTTGDPTRFLQIVINPVPTAGLTQNLAGVTKRWNVPAAIDPTTGDPAGRAERVGDKVADFDPLIQAPRFANAGNSFPYSPDVDHKNEGLAPSFLEIACSDQSDLPEAVQKVMNELQSYLQQDGPLGPALLAATKPGDIANAQLANSLDGILALLRAIFPQLFGPQGLRLGQALNALGGFLLNVTGGNRQGGQLIWSAISNNAFAGQDQQGDVDFEAISYAVMDGHDYFDVRCQVNVDSIEVFFEATDHMLLAFVDALLAFEANQEINAGRTFVGYISLRFTGMTRALIGQEKFPRTVAVEVSGLRDTDGVSPLIDYALTLALDPNYGGILHWGQRNTSTRSDIEARFGDTPTDPTGNLHTWREALGRITQNGKLDGFSSDFTRRTGLEIVTPIIASLGITGSVTTLPFVVSWDCDQNPAATTISLKVVSPSGTVFTFDSLPLAGDQSVTPQAGGVYTATLTAALDLGGEHVEVTRQATITLVAPNQ